MESELSKTVNLYVEKEAELQVNSMKLYRSMVLEYFGRYLDASKGVSWTPADIANEDVVRFYLESHGDGEKDADRYLAEIRKFMRFLKVRQAYEEPPHPQRGER